VEEGVGFREVGIWIRFPIEIFFQCERKPNTVLSTFGDIIILVAGVELSYRANVVLGEHKYTEFPGTILDEDCIVIRSGRCQDPNGRLAPCLPVPLDNGWFVNGRAGLLPTGW
jgi:hypothetical protein